MPIKKVEPQKKPDRLSTLISHFSVQARVCPALQTDPVQTDRGSHTMSGAGPDTGPDAGPDAGVTGFESAQIRNDGTDEDGPVSLAANFFILQRGQLRSLEFENLELENLEFENLGPEFQELADDVPLLIFYPRGAPKGGDPKGQVLKPKGQGGQGSVCAVVDMGGVANPIALALPDQVIVRLDQSSSLQAVTDMLLEEVCAPRCGGQAVIDRLCEIVVIRLLRHLIKAGQAEIGLLAGLADPNLSLAIVAIHDNPERNFRLEDLAEIAAMSRTHFVNSFKKSVGVTPGQYLSNWRLTLARMEIAKGTSLKIIARRIGFSSPAALSRAFTRHFGTSPRMIMRKELQRG